MIIDGHEKPDATGMTKEGGKVKSGVPRIHLYRSAIVVFRKATYFFPYPRGAFALSLSRSTHP